MVACLFPTQPFWSNVGCPMWGAKDSKVDVAESQGVTSRRVITLGCSVLGTQVAEGKGRHDLQGLGGKGMGRGLVALPVWSQTCSTWEPAGNLNARAPLPGSQSRHSRGGGLQSCAPLWHARVCESQLSLLKGLGCLRGPSGRTPRSLSRASLFEPVYRGALAFPVPWD